MAQEKNRHITFAEYFSNLQKEYIIAELRGKIYHKEADKIYYTTREMPGKRRTIEAISARNNFRNIFNDTPTKEHFYREVYSEWGLPNFVYRSSEDRVNRRPLDIINFFFKKTSVSVKLEDESIEKGVIVWTDLEHNLVHVEVNGTVLKLPYERVSRMFWF